MNGPLRLSVLCACALAGIGLAAGVVTVADPELFQLLGARCGIVAADRPAAATPRALAPVSDAGCAAGLPAGPTADDRFAQAVPADCCQPPALAPGSNKQSPAGPLSPPSRGPALLDPTALANSVQLAQYQYEAPAVPAAQPPLNLAPDSIAAEPERLLPPAPQVKPPTHLRQPEKEIAPAESLFEYGTRQFELAANLADGARQRSAVRAADFAESVQQAQYQAPQFVVPQPAFAQQADPNAAAGYPAAPQPANGAQQPSGSYGSVGAYNQGGGSDAGMPSTGDGITAGPQPPPSLNGPWAAGGVQPGSNPPPGPASNIAVSPQQPPAQLPGPDDSSEQPEPPEQPEKAAAPAPPARQPRAEIKRGEGDNSLTIHIQDTDLREVLDLLSEQGGLNILASNNVDGRVSASLTNVDVDTALAAILKSTGYTTRRDGKFIYVGTAKDFQGMTQANERLGTRIYRLNYVKASEFQALIVPLLTPGGVGMVSVSPPGQIGIPADVNNTNGDLWGGSETVLVRDLEGVLAQIDQVFEEVDVRPMQVAIEAMIISVALKDQYSFGVNFQFLRDNANVITATGTPQTSLGQISFANGGLQFGFLDTTLSSFINALETIGDTNVLATPRLTCLNKHRAEILIGSQQGYVNSTSQNLTSTTQAVAFLETGTQLRLRPFISTDGMIRMEVHPESSTGTVTLVGGYTLPNKDVTEVTTNVMVPDGRTVIIGGLMREELDNTTNQLPLLGSLPGIGWLFRNKQENTLRNELIVLITPHIVYEPCASEEGEKAACDFHRRQSVYADSMTPINTPNLGKRYFRLAQSAWAKGDGKAALRFVNLSLHFDPSSRAAIDLRSDIMAGSHAGPHSAGAALPPAPAAMDGKETPGWVLDNLEPGAHSAPEPVHPLQPGHPGRIRSITRPGGMQ